MRDEKQKEMSTEKCEAVNGYEKYLTICTK
jgi:hypothetical protein